MNVATGKVHANRRPCCNCLERMSTANVLPLDRIPQDAPRCAYCQPAQVEN